MYRERLWTMRQPAGFGQAESANLHFKRLLSQGQTWLSLAFDSPTRSGYDSDHPKAVGEVGKCGVAIDSLADMETLFSGIRLDEVSIAISAGSSAAILWAMVLAAAEKQGIDWGKLSGAIQDDILGEHLVPKTFMYPPRASMRIVTDILGFASRQAPRWDAIAISGYPMREAGSTAIQELAFTLRNGIEYIDAGVRAGLDVDDIAPRLSFFFGVHNDFFEEIAKLRAARRMWAHIMRERFHARNERSLLCRIHCRTSSASLTAQQPYNNVVRVTLQALAAVFGGTQSLHANSMDENLALPAEKSLAIALRTQQIIAYESGIPYTSDPLGGSYFLESLTNELESGAETYIKRIDAMGGMIPAIERGYPQREIQESASAFAKALESKEKIIVGFNEFTVEEPSSADQAVSDNEAHKNLCAKLKKLRAKRSRSEVGKSLSSLKRAAETNENLMPAIVSCVRSYATLGEISDALRAVFGEYQKPSLF
jgi:methylmalonyl-CoA mutase N-terminal domain/subunit